LIEARRVSEKLVELEAQKNEESKSSKVAVRRKALLRVKPVLPSGLLGISIWLAHWLSWLLFLRPDLGILPWCLLFFTVANLFRPL
jgi:hypothetical protein